MTAQDNKYTLEGKVKARYMPGVAATHCWIAKNYGKADLCENDNSHTGKRFEWANISREYKRDRSDWKRLCPSCHRKMDFTDAQRLHMSEISKGRIALNKKAIASVDVDGNIEYFNSIKEASKKTGIVRTGILNVLSELARTSGGRTWFYTEGA
jgi:hypothetical protein